MRLRTLFLLFPWLWLFATGITEITGHPWTTNIGTVRRAGSQIIRFQKDQNRLPENLSELRAFGYAQNDKPDIYDNYGSRLFYQPLSEKSFVIKSFGRDRTENTILISKDESFSHNVLAPPRGLKVNLSKESRLNFFQATALDGSEAPKGELFASLHTRFSGGEKRLVVQSFKDKQFFMLSVQDAVEEFLWLPSGTELMFSALGSSRYEDGLYYWNLQTNQVKNVLPDLKKKYFPKLGEDQKLLLSLSHASAKPDFLYILATPMPDSGELDPKEFYRYQNFYALNPKADFSAERVLAEGDFNIFDYDLDHRALINPAESVMALPAQKAWLDLSMSGDKQSLLESWQAYASTYSTSASLPYALWWLGSIYNDTYRDLLKLQPENARTIRNFALEIADALSQLPSGPFYIRAFAEHLKKSLLSSTPAAYNVTPITAASDVKLDTKALEGEKQEMLDHEKAEKETEKPANEDPRATLKKADAIQDKAPSDSNTVDPKREDPK